MAYNTKLTHVKGTVAYALNQHLQEMNVYMKSPSTFPQLRAKVEEILHSPEITTEPGRAKALKTLRDARSYSHYLSILGTWLTGITC